MHGMSQTLGKRSAHANIRTISLLCFAILWEQLLRAGDLWLATAVATLWTVTLGSAVELGPCDSAPDLPDLSAILGVRAATRPRTLRLFRLGWLWLLVQLIEGQELPMPRRLAPEPWPDIPVRLDLVLLHQKALSYACM